MFQPNTKARKLLERANCAYVYPDGVVVWEEAKTRNGKYSANVDVFHIFPCEIKVTSDDYSNGSWGSGPFRGAAKSFTVYNPKMLMSGVSAMRVAYHSQSESMKERGIDSTSIELVAPNGFEVEVHVFPWISGPIGVNPDPVNDRYRMAGFTSILDWEKDRDGFFEWYGDKPTEN